MSTPQRDEDHKALGQRRVELGDGQGSRASPGSDLAVSVSWIGSPRRGEEPAPGRKRTAEVGRSSADAIHRARARPVVKKVPATARNSSGRRVRHTDVLDNGMVARSSSSRLLPGRRHAASAAVTACSGFDSAVVVQVALAVDAPQFQPFRGIYGWSPRRAI